MSNRSKARGVDTGGKGENRGFQVETEEAGMRLDRLLAKRFPEHSRSYLRELCHSFDLFDSGTPFRGNTYQAKTGTTNRAFELINIVLSKFN